MQEAEFEKWAIVAGLSVDVLEGRYFSEETRVAYAGWLGAIKGTYEETSHITVTGDEETWHENCPFSGSRNTCGTIDDCAINYCPTTNDGGYVVTPKSCLLRTKTVTITLKEC